MKTRALALTCLLAGCSGPGQLVATSKQASLCWWRDVRWDAPSRLLTLQDAQPFARLAAPEAPEAQARFTGSLRQAGDALALTGRWEGGGLRLQALVALSAETPLAAWDTRRLGPTSLVLKGAPLRVLDARVGAVLAAPREAATAAVSTPHPLTAEVACDALSLRHHDASPTAQLVAAGFSETAPGVSLIGAAPVPYSAEARGPMLGALHPDAAPLYEVAREGDRARVVLPTREGVVWAQWVDAALLQPATPAAPVEPARALPTHQAVETEEWLACDTAQIVAISVNGRHLIVGELSPGAAFSVRAVDETWAVVRLSNRWFTPDDTVAVMLPAAAASCSQATINLQE